MGRLGGAAKSLLLLIVGIVTQFVFGNVIIATVISFVLGLILFRGKKAKPASSTKVVPATKQARRVAAPRPTEMPKPREARRGIAYCRSCGTEMLLNDRFCPDCGARQLFSEPRMEDKVQRYPPEEIVTQFKTMKELYLKGQLDGETYLDVINNMVLVDEWGRYWTIGANTLRWYRNQEGTWRPDQPEGRLSITNKKEIRAHTGLQY